MAAPMASSSSHASTCNKVLRHTYVEAEYTRLIHLNSNAIEEFLTAYDYVSRLRRKDGLELMRMRDCVEDELFEVITEYNRQAWQDKNLIFPAEEPQETAVLEESDKTAQDAKLMEPRAVEATREVLLDKLLREYLEEKLSFETADDAVRAFAAISMSMSIRDFDERLGAYDVAFNKVLKKAKALKLKTTSIARKYIEGIRPESVRSELKAEFECDGVTLADMRAKARSALLENNKQYTRRRAAETQAPPNVRVMSSPASQHDHDTPRTLRNPYVPTTHTPFTPRPVSNTTTSAPAPYATRLRDKGMCNGCGGKVPWTPDHWKTCVGNKHKDTPKPRVAVHTVTVNSVESARGPLRMSVLIGSLSVQAVLDTGAAVSCVSRGLAERLTRLTEVVYRPTDTNLQMADGSRVPTRLVGFTIEVPTARAIATSITLPWFFHELPDQRDKLLLGMDMLRDLGMVEGDCIILPLERSMDGSDPVPDDGLDDVLNEVLADEHDRFQTPMLEAMDGTDSAHDPYESMEYLKVVVPESIISESVRKILLEYRDVFDVKLIPGQARLPMMPIQLLSDKVVHITARPLKPSVRTEVESQLADAERMGLIRPSTSPYQSPVVIARKKDGTLRVCFDYSALNKIIKPHEYPMPSIHKIWQSQIGACYYGTGDLRSGFNQMLVVPEHVHLTAFATPDRKGETVAAFFGMRNTPAYFQEAMDTVMADLEREEGLTQYIDDTQFHGRDGPEFIRRLELYLKRCRTYGLRLKAEKCVFGASQVHMLGCVISKEGRSIAPERVEAVRSLPAPRDRTELRMFMGKVVFFQDLVPDMHRIAAPLYELMKKTTGWIWEDTHQAAFDALKDALTSETILANPDEEGKLVLRTDASKIGLGGVLLLRACDRPDRPVCYFSHKFTDTQQRWSTYEQELFAILYCLTRQLYSQLLKLHHFSIEMDHRNLQYLSGVEAERSPKLTRWKIILLEYSFDIKHISGITNTVADCLSRYGFAPESPTSKGVTNWPASVDSIETVEQANAEFWEKMKAAQSNLTPLQRIDLLVDEDGVCRDHTGLCVVPADAKELKDQLLRVAHGTPFTGHQGAKRCADSIRLAGFEWESLDQDVQAYIQACPVCQKTRFHRHGVTHMATTSVSEVMHTLAVDSIGPFPADRDGNQYILVLCDVGSRISRLTATRSTDAVTAANVIMREVVARMGIPQVIRSDGGSQFANQVINALCTILHIHHHRVLPYQPQSNGVVERVNGEVMRHLRCLLLDAEKSAQWSDLLPVIEFIINNSIHSSLGVTPNAMMFGHLAANRFDFPTLIAEANPMAIEGGKAKEYIEGLQQQLAFIRNSAERAQAIATAIQRNRHNQNEPTVYKPGDFVLLKRTHDERPSKLETLWLGPYKITECVTPLVYTIQYLYDPSRLQTVHHMRLIPFNVRPDIPLDQLSNMAEYDSGELLVESVLSHTGFNKRDVRFLIHWRGFPSSEDSWEPWSHVEGNTKIVEYIRANPELMHLLRERKN